MTKPSEALRFYFIFRCMNAMSKLSDAYTVMLN